MKRICLGAFVAMAGLACAHGQSILPHKKKEIVYRTPMIALGEKFKRKLTEQEYRDHLWNLRRSTQREEDLLRENLGESESGPFLSRRSVWASETMTRRAAEFGRGKYTKEASSRISATDRWNASQTAETSYPGKAQDDAIAAAVYRHFFDYRKLGFGRKTTVYFLGYGPHAADAPPSILLGLDSDTRLEKEGITLRPMSKLMEVTDDAIRDRDTGAYGAAFRVDAIGPIENGSVKVNVAFSERDGFWFARQFTLQQGKSGWTVVRDDDMPASTDR